MSGRAGCLGGRVCRRTRLGPAVAACWPTTSPTPTSPFSRRLPPTMSQPPSSTSTPSKPRRPSNSNSSTPRSRARAGSNVGGSGLDPPFVSHEQALVSIRNFLKGRSSYDVFPVSFRLIVLDTKLMVKKALGVMLQNGQSGHLLPSPSLPRARERELASPSDHRDTRVGGADARSIVPSRRELSRSVRAFGMEETTTSGREGELARSSLLLPTSSHSADSLSRPRMLSHGMTDTLSCSVHP